MQTEVDWEAENTGGLYLALEDFNTMFSMLSNEPLIINDFDVSTEEARKEFNGLLMTQYDGDTLESVASCGCGNMRKGFYVGQICSKCRQPVFTITEQPLESYLWIRTPTGIASLMNPTAWNMLSDAFTANKLNLLEWICVPGYRVKNENASLKKVQAVFEQVVLKDGTQLKRSWNYFHDHFDEIIDLLITYGSTRKKIDKEHLRSWIRENRDKIFCNFLPVPSRLSFITESTATGMYAESTMRPALAAIRSVSELEFSVLPLSEAVVEKRVVKIISQLSEFYKSFVKDKVRPKLGLARQHIFGSRVNFTARGVISPISDPHHYEDVYLPWKIAVPLMWIHLSKLLLDRGMSANEINQFLSERVNRYDPLLDEMFQELIRLSPEGGLPILLNRNPSLDRSSVQALRVTKIKTDVNDYTIQLSVLILAGFNGLKGLVASIRKGGVKTPLTAGTC